MILDKQNERFLSFCIKYKDRFVRIALFWQSALFVNNYGSIIIITKIIGRAIIGTSVLIMVLY